MAEVTVYHGTSGDVAQQIRLEGLKRPTDGNGPHVTPSRELALGFAWGAAAGKACMLGGCLYGTLVTASVDETLLGPCFTEHLVCPRWGAPPAGMPAAAPAHCLTRGLRPEECRVRTVDVLGARQRTEALRSQRNVQRTLTEIRGLSYAELGARAGVSAATVRRFETGETVPDTPHSSR